MSDDVAEAATRRPPRAVWSAIVVLGLLALDNVAALVVAAAPSDMSGAELAYGIVWTLTRVAILSALARLLWRGSSSGRVLTILFGVLNAVVAAATGLVGSQGVELVWTIVELVVVGMLVALMFTAAMRSWCRGGQLDRSADDARDRRREQRANLSWGPRLAQAFRDDRDARR